MSVLTNPVQYFITNLANAVMSRKLNKRYFPFIFFLNDWKEKNTNILSCNDTIVCIEKSQEIYIKTTRINNWV